MEVKTENSPVSGSAVVEERGQEREGVANGASPSSCPSSSSFSSSSLGIQPAVGQSDSCQPQASSGPASAQVDPLSCEDAEKTHTMVTTAAAADATARENNDTNSINNDITELTASNLPSMNVELQEFLQAPSSSSPSSPKDMEDNSMDVEKTVLPPVRLHYPFQYPVVDLNGLDSSKQGHSPMDKEKEQCAENTLIAMESARSRRCSQKRSLTPIAPEDLVNLKRQRIPPSAVRREEGIVPSLEPSSFYIYVPQLVRYNVQFLKQNLSNLKQTKNQKLYPPMLKREGQGGQGGQGEMITAVGGTPEMRSPSMTLSGVGMGSGMSQQVASSGVQGYGGVATRQGTVMTSSPSMMVYQRGGQGQGQGQGVNGVHMNYNTVQSTATSRNNQSYANQQSGSGANGYGGNNIVCI